MIFKHWQNLNEKHGERLGPPIHGRCWWHLEGLDPRKRNRDIGFSWNLWTHFCHASIEIGDKWQFSIALPPVAFWLSFEGFALLRKLTPRKKCVATWDNNREFYIADERESGLSIHNWGIWINPWSKRMEWASKDPWWVKGLHVDIPDLIFGRAEYSNRTISEQEVVVPMPEKNYHGKVTIFESTWKRSRWFPKRMVRTTIDMAEPIPFPGKGENSWDCCEDAMHSLTCPEQTVVGAISATVKSVLGDRTRYGGSYDWKPGRSLK